MIKPIANWDKIQAYDGDYERLEAGGYIVKILNVKQEKSSKGNDMLVIYYDIKEGEHAGYFRRKYNAAKERNPKAKWGGVMYIVLPQEAQSKEMRELSERRLKSLTTAVEESNSGYKWDWDETKLKDKTVGGLFGREEYMGNDGEYRWSTKLRFFTSQETIDSGNYSIQKDKPAKRDDYTIGGFQEIDSAIEGNSDLPF